MDNCTDCGKKLPANLCRVCLLLAVRA